MLQLFFFQQRREGGGLNFVMSQISFLWLLVPALLPRLPLHARLGFFFFFFFSFLNNFPRFTSRLRYLRLVGILAGLRRRRRALLLAQHISLPGPLCSAAHPAEARAPPCPAALPRPRRGVRPAADALVLLAEEPASCPGATGLMAGGKAEGGRPTIQF